MAWERKTLKVLAEIKDRDGKLKHRWEITRKVNEAEDKKFARELTKTSFYVKDGVNKEFSVHLPKADLTWIVERAAKLWLELDPPPEVPKPAPAAEPEDVPF
jgi:hypothetical protein